MFQVCFSSLTTKVQLARRRFTQQHTQCAIGHACAPRRNSPPFPLRISLSASSLPPLFNLSSSSLPLLFPTFFFCPFLPPFSHFSTYSFPFQTNEERKRSNASTEIGMKYCTTRPLARCELSLMSPICLSMLKIKKNKKKNTKKE